jgi:hypothetical protein
VAKYTIEIYTDALQDIQNSTIWYNEQAENLGSLFQAKVKRQIGSLKNNPHIYAIRYSNVRCMPIEKFPFLIHFVIDEVNFKVQVFAIFHTSRNPTIWLKRKINKRPD